MGEPYNCTPGVHNFVCTPLTLLPLGTLSPHRLDPSRTSALQTEPGYLVLYWYMIIRPQGPPATLTPPRANPPKIEEINPTTTLKGKPH